MTTEEKIHHLFNELNSELHNYKGYESVPFNVDPKYTAIASAVDAAHHDFTNITLQEVA